MSSKSQTRRLSIVLNDNGTHKTIRQIAKEARVLAREIRNDLTPGTEKYNKKVKELSTLKKVLREHNQKIRGTSKAWMQSKLSVGNFVGFLAAGATVSTLVAAGGRLFNIAAQMELAGNKAETVFGPALAAVRVEAEKNANTMGLTNDQYVQMATNIGDLLIPMGFQRQEASGISTDLVNLSGALSEWTGGTIKAADVSRILSKAMLGEREELKQLGISIKEADVKARLAEKGMDKLTGQMLEQAKAAATLELITEKSTDAQTAFAESSGSLVRDKAELTAKVRELGERLATTLIPVFVRLVEVADSTLTVIEKVARAFGGVKSKANVANQAYYDQIEAVKGLDKNLVPLLDQYDTLFTKTDKNEKEQQDLKTVIGEIGEIVPGAITKVNDYGTALNINRKAVTAFYEENKELIDSYKELAKERAIEAIDRLENQHERLTHIVETGRKSRQALGGRQTKALQFEIDNARGKLEGIKKDILDQKEKLSRLEADVVKTPIVEPDDDGDGDGGGGGSPIVPTVETLEKAEKELESHLDRVQEFIKTAKAEYDLSLLSGEDQEIENIKAKYQEQIDLVSQEEGNQSAIITDLYRLRQQEIDKIRNEFEEKRVEEQEKRLLENEQREIEAEILKETKKAEVLKEIDAILNPLSDEEEEVLRVKSIYEALLSEAKKYGIETIDLERKLKEELDKIDEEWTVSKVLRLLYTSGAYKDVLNDMGNAFMSLGEIFIESERGQVEFQKVAALARIAYDTAIAISAITKSAATRSADPVQFILTVSAGVASVLASIAQAKKAFSQAPALPQKRHGSWYDVTGQDDGRNYNAQFLGRRNTGMLPGNPSLVLASEDGPEYYVSNRSLRNPLVANYVAMIDAITKRRIPQFRDGSSLSESGTAAGVPSPAGDNTALLRQIHSFLSILVSGGVKAVVEDDYIVSAHNRLKQLDQDSGGNIL